MLVLHLNDVTPLPLFLDKGRGWKRRSEKVASLCVTFEPKHFKLLKSVYVHSCSISNCMHELVL